jgi:hypothetical protein
MLIYTNMVTVEVDLEAETVQELSEEAAEFEFQGSEPYVRWLIEHRGVFATEGAELDRRLEHVESRLVELEEDVEAERDERTNDDSVRAQIDELLAVTNGSDDNEIEEAVATVEGTVDEDFDL